MTEITVATGRKANRSRLLRAPPHAASAAPPSAATRPARETLADRRFETIMGREAWLRLPSAVRQRFSVKPAPGSQRIFAGTILDTRLSLIGRVLAHAARLAGGPLPFSHGATGPTTVIVTEDASLGGQIWTRVYARPGNFPQTINSAKRLFGTSQLEEYLGFGLVMRLRLAAEDGALVFQSAGYYLVLGRHRIRLPDWLSPGRCTVTHRASGPERFTFTLALDHPWAGRLAWQSAEFVEADFREIAS